MHHTVCRPRRRDGLSPSLLPLVLRARCHQMLHRRWSLCLLCLSRLSSPLVIALVHSSCCHACLSQLVVAIVGRPRCCCLFVALVGCCHFHCCQRRRQQWRHLCDVVAPPSSFILINVRHHRHAVDHITALSQSSPTQPAPPPQCHPQTSPPLPIPLL